MATITIPLQGDSEVRLRYSRDNKALLRSLIGGGKRLEWDRDNKCWLVSRATALSLAQFVPAQFGTTTVYWQVRAGAQRCDIRCQNAVSLDCTCACGGVYHGIGTSGSEWTVVGSTTLIADGGTHWLSRTERAAA
jgi:hypothetical protein